jgi:methylmalonyl-CoA mutase N-terminal domain/subunit
MRDECGATDPRAQQLRFHTQTAGSTLTAVQSDNNIVRVALQALSAVLGGTQSLHCNGRDEALALPTEASAVLALRTQQILLHETGVANTVDPVGGSYTIERKTDEIEQAAEGLLARLEANGGALAAIESGYVQRQIQEEAYRTQQAIDRGERVVVGVNRFAQRDAESSSALGSPGGFRLDTTLEREQIERVRHVRATRSRSEWKDALASLTRAAIDGTNLVPPIILAVEKHATVGEISDTLRAVFGTYEDVSNT